MPDRALLTGASGFVGGHVAKALVEAGFEVRCAVRAGSDTRHLANLPVERVPLGLNRPAVPAEAVEGTDVVVHAAGITRARRPEDFFSVNTEGTQRLAEAAQGAGVRRFVFVSSLAARGPDAEGPAADSAGSAGDEDRPASAYGRSKLEAETYLRAFGGGMEVVVLRPAAVYGPRDKDLLPLFRMAAAGWIVVPSGEAPLQPVYAGDVARAVVAATREPVVGFGPFPVAERGRYTWPEVVVGMEGALGRRVRAVRAPAALFGLAGSAAERLAGVRGKAPLFDRRRAEDLAVHSWTCDVSGTEEALGWRAEVTLPEGLARTARWYRDSGWLGIKAR